jgi:hypothetical protein
MEMDEKKSGMHTFNQTFKIKGKDIESTFTFCKEDSQTFRDLYEKYKQKIALMYKRCFGYIADKFPNTVSVLHYKKDGNDTEFFGIADLTPDPDNPKKYTLWSVCIDVSLLNALPSLGQQLLTAIVDWSDFDLDLYVDLKNPFFHKAFKLYLKNKFTLKDIVQFPGSSKLYIHMYREKINPKSVISISDTEYIKLLLKYKDYPEIRDLVQQYKAQISVYFNDGERSLYTHYYKPFYSPTSTICITQKEYDEITKIFEFVKGEFNTDVKREFTTNFNVFFSIIKRDDHNEHIFLVYKHVSRDDYTILDTGYSIYDFLDEELKADLEEVKEDVKEQVKVEEVKEEIKILTYKFKEIYDKLLEADANPISNLQQKEPELFSHLGFCMVWTSFFYDCLISKVDIDTVYKTLLLSSPYSLTKFILIYFDMISQDSETSLVKRVEDSIMSLARRTGKSQQKAKMSSSTPIKSELPAQPAVAPIVCNDFLNLHNEYNVDLIRSKINKYALGDQKVDVFHSKFKHKTKIIKKSLKKRSVGYKKSPKKSLKKSHLKRTFVKKSKKVKKSVSRR